tara:strand:+ start:5414 stop:8137 length:2724 start_codon:yes stop_codon:yes gene_type:complete
MNRAAVTQDEAWHALQCQAVLDLLDSTTGGLGQNEAEVRLAAIGRNELPERKHRVAIFRFLSQFHNVLIYVLLASSAITLLLGHLLDTGVILAVVFVNAAIGFLQEGKAERAMEAIRRLLAPQATVLRDGKRRRIEATQLVPGDVISLSAGDRVPADVRLLTAAGLQIQEAVLTGESLPIEKSTSAVSEDVPLGDRTSMAFSGTLVTSGTGEGVVVATGISTQAGRISRMLSEVTTVTTPLVRQMNDFARWLTILILLVAGVLLVFGYAVRHYDFDEMFMAVVGLSVAAIPEGLPAVFTITLAVGVQAMARRDAIVRRLPAIETLGSVNVICTDKTGTLTRNEMMVASIVTAGEVFSVRGVGYEPAGEILAEHTENAARGNQGLLAEVGLLATLCNDASLHHSAGTWGVEGDPMEGALLSLSAKIGLDLSDTRQEWPRLDVIPFDAQRRYMATLHQTKGGKQLVVVKGAPEQLLSMCHDQHAAAGKPEALDEAYWNQQAERIAGMGHRVLALAASRPDSGESSLPACLKKSLTLVGLVGLIDPPRPEAKNAVAECQAAGIRVKMITGDHKGTAESIARQLGIQDCNQVLSGADLDRMNDAELASEALQTGVFARTSPEHKLRLVQALQALDKTVAMTGDGVNDAPALKRADVGIAMGKTGTEAAKEAAAIVLADDNFASIVAAVSEGRTVYDNFRKVVSWTLPTSSGEALTIIVALLFNMILPVTPVQILWINLVTVATLGLALAFEPTEPNTMQRPPRARNEPLLSKVLVWHIVFVSILFLAGVFGVFSYAIDQGYSIASARTMAVNTLVVLEVFHLFYVRNMYGTSITWDAIRGTRIVWVTVGIVTLAQLSITYFPPLQIVFDTEPVSFVDGLLIVAVSIVCFSILEIEKQIRLSFAPRKKARLH